MSDLTQQTVTNDRFWHKADIHRTSIGFVNGASMLAGGGTPSLELPPCVCGQK